MLHTTMRAGAAQALALENGAGRPFGLNTPGSDCVTGRIVEERLLSSLKRTLRVKVE